MATRRSASQCTHSIHGDKVKFRIPNDGKSCATDNCGILNSGPEGRIRKLKYNTLKRHNKRKENWISEFKIMTGNRKSVEITVHDNNKYFRRPIIPFLVPKTQNIEIPARFHNEVLNDIVKNAQKQCYEFLQKSEPCKTVGTQTIYRDSEAQTLPWDPPYKIKSGHNPEALTIAHLTWKHGLPAGMHELEIINRMRMKRAWEAILPPMDTPANIKIRNSIISALEIDQWAFRESEIQTIMDCRLELMQKLQLERDSEKQAKLDSRFGRLKECLTMRRDSEVKNIRHRLKRDLRKLYKKYNKRKPLKRDIIAEHADPASEVYAPQMRFGEKGKDRHEVIRKELLKETCIENAEQINTMPNWLPTYEELKAIKPKPKPSDLCVRETRWTEETLKRLYYDLKKIRMHMEPVQTLSLMKRRYELPALPSTPYILNEENEEEKRVLQYSTLIQKIVRGRAVQCMMFEGRERCKELIEELKSSHTLDKKANKKWIEERNEIMELQRLQNDRILQEDRLCEILNSLEGSALSTMLDFLSKELVRLEDERRAHAFALLAERERSKREAAEAGRRQLERNRRREFDEMFRQIVKVHQDTVETYLEDIIKEGVEWVSDEAAKEYILELCDKVDNIVKDAEENASELEHEEMVANMIYNFVLPEVEKRNLRKDIKENQQSHLRNAHALIYDQILDLPPVETLKLSDREDESTSAEEEFAEMEYLEEAGEDAEFTKAESVSESGSSNASTESFEAVKSILDLILSDVVEHEGYSSESSESSVD